MVANKSLITSVFQAMAVLKSTNFWHKIERCMTAFAVNLPLKMMFGYVSKADIRF
jgi:hypothetical protein